MTAIFTGSSGGRDFYQIEVEADPSLKLLGAVEAALTAQSLETWLVGDVHTYLSEEIGLRFAYEGDKKSGNWPALADATNRIRESQGFPGQTPINIRTGQLRDWVTTHYDVMPEGEGATLLIPGDPPTTTLATKLETAQLGRPDNVIPGYAPTPPRPILALDETDAAVILESLNRHLIGSLAGML